MSTPVGTGTADPGIRGIIEGSQVLPGRRTALLNEPAGTPPMNAPAHSLAPDWTALRREFPTLERWTYLDAARKTPLARCAERAMQEYTRDIYEEAGAEAWNSANVGRTRTLLAQLLGCTPTSLAFTKNTAEGLAIAAHAFELRAGDNILLTDMEHVVNLWVWKHYEAKGVEIRKVESRDGRMPIEAYLEKIDALCELLADWGLLVEGEEKPDGTIDWFPTDTPVTINIEAISYQQSLQADAKEILIDKRSLHNLVLRGVTGYRGDKLSRFRGILGLFQTGRITWNRWINWEAYHAELLNYGATDHDDCPDSLLLAIKGLVGPGRLQPAWGEWRDD